MKHLRQLFLGLLVVVALSIPAFAGEIGCPGATDGPQESPGVTCKESPDIKGDVSTPGIVTLILAAIVVV